MVYRMSVFSEGVTRTRFEIGLVCEAVDVSEGKFSVMQETRGEKKRKNEGSEKKK